MREKKTMTTEQLNTNSVQNDTNPIDFIEQKHS